MQQQQICPTGIGIYCQIQDSGTTKITPSVPEAEVEALLLALGLQQLSIFNTKHS